MNERVKKYLESQEKKSLLDDKLYRSKVLIEAELYESYLGPHVEEIFEPIPPKKSISKIDKIQYVIEKATNQILAVKYNFKEKEFEVFTPIEVTEDEFNQIKRYSKVKI